MLARIDHRQQLYGRMLDLGMEINAHCAEFLGSATSPGQEREFWQRIDRTLQAEIERLRRQANEELESVARWLGRAREMVLEAARHEPRLLGIADRLDGLRSGWDLGATAMRRAVLKTREALEEAMRLLQLQEPAPEPPKGSAPAQIGNEPEPEMLTVAEAAARLRISAKKIYRLAALGRIPHLRLGRSLRFRSRELDRWLSQHSVTPRRS